MNRFRENNLLDPWPKTSRNAKIKQKEKINWGLKTWLPRKIKTNQSLKKFLKLCETEKSYFPFG